MFRILSALLLAIFCHLLLFLLPLPQSTLPPQLPGKKGIEVQLHTQEDTPPTPPIPLQPDIVAPVSPAVVAQASEAAPATIVPKSLAVTRIRKKTLKKRLPAITPASTPPQKKEIPQPNPPHNKVSPPAIVEAVPLYQQNPKPEYPSLARRRNWQGTVILSVVVSEEGIGKSIQIHTSSGHVILDKAALQTVNTWHFRPGTKANIPIEMQVLVPIHFSLED